MNQKNKQEYNCTIVGLSPSTSYVFYFVFSNESPFDTIVYSPVYSVAITTLAINYAASFGRLLEVVGVFHHMIIALISVMISMAFM